MAFCRRLQWRTSRRWPVLFRNIPWMAAQLEEWLALLHVFGGRGARATFKSWLNREFELAARNAVLLLAHGSPDSVDDIPEFLSQITRGRPVPAEAIEEVKRR